MNKFRLDTFQKLMIIVWKWRHPGSDDPLTEVDFGADGLWEPAWRVEGDNNAAILRIDPATVEDGYYEKLASMKALEESMKKIENILLQRKGPPFYTQVFLHASQGYRTERKSHLLEFCRENGCLCEINIFHHSDTVLYSNTKTPLGLIKEDGNWGETLVHGKTSKAKAGPNLIAADHFNFVWETYEALPKKKTYELYQRLFRILLPVALNERVKDLSEYPEQTEQIKSIIKSYMDDFAADPRFSEIRSSLSALTEQLEQGALRDLKIDLNRVRSTAIELLNKLPGHRIYV